jgi:hypothetical protein
MVVFEGHLAHRRRAVVRVGWNDAAWGQPRQDPDAHLAPWYERGFTGGLIFRQKDQLDMSDQDITVAQPQALAEG